ncbi:MAG: ABC transporter ATP-binding protein/permease [Actinobacteria bacterium]|nr:ABC transporter ATP-binding protein/permease [Actinomycetota bacterium]
MKNFYRLMSFTLGRRYLLVLGFTCAVGLTLAGIAIPWLVKEGIDRAFPTDGSGRPDLLWPLAGGILGLALLRFLFGFGRRYSTNYLGHVVEYRLRKALFEKMLSLHHGFYDKASTGELVSRTTNDLRVVRSFVGWGMFQLFISLLTLVVVSAALLYLNAPLALIVLSPMPFLAFAAWRFAAKVHPIFRSVQQKLADVTTVVQENVSGIRVVKSFSREPFETDRFGDRAEGVLNETLAARGLRAFYIPGMSFLPATSVAILILFGGRAVVEGTLTVGEFALFQLYLMQLVWPMQGFGMVIDQGQRALAACERVFEILDSEPDVLPPKRPVPFPEAAPAVEFREVSFSYEVGDSGDEPVLEGVNLRVEPGEAVAVVGATGSGKSTLLSLVPRFYDPDRGSILVGGANVRELDPEELRRNVGIVPQETFLFSETVRDNITFGNPDAGMEEVEKAAKTAGIHDQIFAFPEGYDTMVGEWGITLSGGQKQRVAIARALVKDPKILVLDDATSSVDAETEKSIQEALRGTLQESSGRTTFIVAHRLSTILLADRIVVLERGRVVEAGTHEELLRRRGRYHALYGEERREERMPA